MQPKNWYFGGGATETILHPLAALAMLVAMVLILTLPRRKVIAPFLLTCLTIPVAQVIVIGSLHFTVWRILILTALGRAILQSGRVKKDRFPGGFNRLDQVVMLWITSILVINSLQWMELQALVKLFGDFLDLMGCYLVARYFIPDRETLRRTIAVLALICVIQGVCMMSEQTTHKNVFAFLGAREPEMRSGHVRSEGSLGTLYSGPFAAVLIPMFLWLWTEKGSKGAAALGLIGATAMVFFSHASTSWGAYGSGLLGLCFWPLRRQMRLVRYGIVATLVGLHLVMHGPVWSLIEKVDLTGGSSSYHRYMLVDNCIRHFDQWWLLGFGNPGSWGLDMFDLCNQFVACALTGGLVGLILFIMVYSRSFGMIGNARRQASTDRRKELLLWCLGSTLFANVVASFGINYMLQLQMLLLPLLACVSVAASEASRAVVQTAKKRQDLQLAHSGANPPISQTA